MDDVDEATERNLRRIEEGIARARVPLAPGVAGECPLCGEYSPRIVLGACPPCRDRRGLE